MENFLDDKLIRGVVEFLFVPESILSIIFLVIFVLLFIYGLVKVSKCKSILEDYRTNSAEYFQKEKEHINQSQFLSRLRGELAVQEIKVIDLPNVFISVGILGTFLGLGVAIHGAADLLTSDSVDLNKLNEVLSVIAFKFQMSVWGTIFSLIFQKFIAEPYFVRKQVSLGEIFTAIYSNAVNYSTALEWQLAELQGIRAGQTEAKITFTGELKDIQARQNAFLNGLNENGKVQKDIADKQEISNANRMTQFGNLIDKMLTHQTDMNEKLVNHQTDMNEKLVQKQTDLNEQLVQKQINLVKEEKDFTAQNGEIIKNHVAEQLEKQMEYFDGLIAQQKTANEELAEQQKAMIENSNAKNETTAKLVIDDVSACLQQQKEFLGNLISKQGSANEELAEQQKAMIENSNAKNETTAKLLIDDISARLQQQKEFLDNLLSKQGSNNEELAARQKALIDNAMSAVEENTKSVLGGVNDQLSQQRDYITSLLEKQNEISNQLAEQERLMIGDVREFNKNNSESVMNSFAEQLDQQRQHMEKLLAEQNEISKQLALQQKMLLDNADEAQRLRAESIADNVEQQLVKQRAFIEKLIAQQSQLNEILLGDMQKSSETNSNYMREGVLQQLEKHKEYVEGLAAKQKELQKSLEDKLDKLDKHIDDANKLNNSTNLEQQKFIKNIFEQQQNMNAAFVEDIQRVNAENLDKLDKHIDDANKLNNNSNLEQQKFIKNIFEQQQDMSAALVEDIQRVNAENNEAINSFLNQYADKLKSLGESSVSGVRNSIAEQIEQYKKYADELKKHIDDVTKLNNANIADQKKYVEKLFDQQSQLNRVLLGDMQKTGKEHANQMREGVLQQMNQYKKYAEDLAAEQKQAQKSLEDKLKALGANIDKTSANSNESIAELRKAMELLQKTLESNSKALNDIISDFYSKQSDLDDLRRTEIMGIAESFNTLLHQEGKNKASWRKTDKDNEKN